jgi:hypothetical protein
MHETKTFFLTKTGYFNTGFIFLRYKNTFIKQNLVEKYVEKSQIFKKKFENVFWIGLDPAHSFWVGSDLSTPMNSGELIHSPLLTQNSGDSAAKKKKKKKKEEGRTCGGFEAVLLAVADWRMAWTAADPSFSFLCFFFCSILPFVPCFIPSPSF